MSIPTGADYHILKAKSHLDDADSTFFNDNYRINKLEFAIGELIKALELIQQERTNETDKDTQR
jgi:hypothetical protein